MPDYPTCECGKSDWIPIPDSLGYACKDCGRVQVKGGPNGWEKGASIQKWMNDVYGTDLEDPDDPSVL